MGCHVSPGSWHGLGAAQLQTHLAPSEPSEYTYIEGE